MTTIDGVYRDSPLELEFVGGNFDGLEVDSFDMEFPGFFTFAVPAPGQSYQKWKRACYRKTDRYTANGRQVYQFQGYEK